MTATMPVMAADGMPPAHINGREAAPDPLEIPEFLRRVH